jgi:carbon-monoxide dehydrogenase medium subunit
MIATAFEYLRPGDLAEALELLAADPAETAILGGGTWLIADLERGTRTPRRVLDLAGAGIDAIEELGDGGLRIGAMCSYADLLAAKAIAVRAPLLRQMAAQITGGSAIRNQATLGGSLIAARPQSDAPAAVVAAGAVAVIAGPGGERRDGAAALFAGAMRSSLAPAEILCAVELPPAAGGHRYEKLKLGASSWPIASAAACVELDGSGCCRAVSLTLGGVSATPLCVDVESILLGAQPTAAALSAAAGLAGHAVTAPWGDVLAPASYRAAVAAPLARRALEGAVLDARKGARA